MTRNEVVKYLKSYIPWADQHELNIDALKSALELLEQEQYYKDLANSYEKTINKLTKAISEQEPKIDVLEQIRAEIINMRSMQNCSCADCLDIIDKYRK